MSAKVNLLTAGGKIQCLRCTAKSTRTGDQCGRPALKSSKTQVCQFHGARSTGPKTAEGKARIAAAHTVHGQETSQARAERSAASARLSRIEDAMYLLEMTTAPRTRGRKARGYVPVKTLDDVRQMVVLDSFYTLIRGSFDQGQNNKRKTHRPLKFHHLTASAL